MNEVQEAAVLEAALTALGSDATAEEILQATVGFNQNAINVAMQRLQNAGGGGSLPAGGSTGEVLTKASNADGDADWEAGGGSQSVLVGPFEWSFENYVPGAPDPGIYDSGNDGFLIAPKGTFPVGCIVQRVLWQIDTPLNNLSFVGPLVTSIGDFNNDYVDGGDIVNTATAVNGGVSVLAVTEEDMISSPPDPPTRSTNSGGVLVTLADQYFVLAASSFSAPPTQGAGRCWIEILTPTAP